MLKQTSTPHIKQLLAHYTMHVLRVCQTQQQPWNVTLITPCLLLALLLTPIAFAQRCVYNKSVAFYTTYNIGVSIFSRRHICVDFVDFVDYDF